MKTSLLTVFNKNIRKATISFFSLLFIITVVSCNLPKKNIERKSIQEPTEMIIADTSVEKGQQIVTDIFELSIDKSLITRSADSGDLGININLYEQDGNIYFILFGTVKNVSSSAISFRNMVNVNLIFDDKYEYAVSIAPSDLSNIVPLKTESFVWYASVPMEIFESASQYKFQWDILNDTNSMQIQSKYSFSGLTSQYWSVENINNFSTFTEYIAFILPDDKNISGVIDEKNQTIIIKSKGIIPVQIADGTFEEFNPRIFTVDEFKLYLDYEEYKKGREYGEIEMRFYILSHIYAFPTSLSFSSSTGSIELDQHIGKWINNYGGDNQQFFYLPEYSYKNNFADFYKIINGNNPEVIVHYHDTDLKKDDVVATANLSITDIETINKLLLIYSDCPKTSLNLQ